MFIILSAVANAFKFLETKQLPSNWVGRIHSNNSDSSISSDEELNDDVDDNDDDVHDDDLDDEGGDGEENDKERDEFLTKLTKFLQENGKLVEMIADHQHLIKN